MNACCSQINITRCISHALARRLADYVQWGLRVGGQGVSIISLPA